MRSEPVDQTAGRLAALADEVESTQGRVRLTREGHPDLVLLSAAELESIEETLFWVQVDLERVRSGEPLDDDVEPGPAMTAEEARAYFARVLSDRRE